MHKQLKISSFLIILLAVSCGHRNEALRLLEKAQNCVEAAPDNALSYLDSIFLAEKFLSKENYMEYIVTNVQAKHKNYIDIKDDTIIFEAKRYFSGKDNSQRTTDNRRGLFHSKAHSSKLIAYSYLYSGCVYEERQEYDKAINEYNQAFHAAELIHDSLLMYRSISYIAIIYSNENYYDKALEKYLQSINYINKYDKEKLAGSYANISKIHLISLNNDSSICYIDKAMDVVADSDNKKLLSYVYQIAHVIYKECNKYDEAKDFLRLAMETNEDSSATSLYYRNLAELYLKTGEQDSTKKYTHKLIKEIDNVNDKAFLASSYGFLSDYYSSVNMNDSALYYQDKLTRTIDKIREDNMKQNIYEVEKKYDYERLSNNYHKKLNSQFKLIIMMLTIVIVLIITISLLIIRKKKNEIYLIRKNEQIAIEMNNLKNEFHLLEDLNSGIKSSVDNILKQRSKLIVKVHNAEKKHKDDDKSIINELKSLVFGSFNKTGLKAAVDLVENTYPKLPAMIKNNYCSLNETEYNVFLLSLLPLSSRDIANLMDLGESSVAKSRTNIRKEIGAEGYGSDIGDFILEKYYISCQLSAVSS